MIPHGAHNAADPVVQSRVNLPARTIGAMTIASLPVSRYRSAGVIAAAAILGAFGILLYAFGVLMFVASFMAIGPEDEVGPARYVLPVGGGSACIVFGAYLVIRHVVRRV